MLNKYIIKKLLFNYCFYFLVRSRRVAISNERELRNDTPIETEVKSRGGIRCSITTAVLSQLPTLHTWPFPCRLSTVTTIDSKKARDNITPWRISQQWNALSRQIHSDLDFRRAPSGHATLTMSFDFSYFGWFAVVLALCLGLILLALPLLLASVAWSLNSNSMKNSTLHVGRVWHARLTPKRHSFTYPIFMFALDLQELETFQTDLWPLVPWIVSFRTEDHLKNGEGETNPNDGTEPKSSNSLADRILRLVQEKTEKKFQPTISTHRILILTHLRYYGYNFNPVSFYYIVDEATMEVAAIVGEVSNTPWTEMYCYVLHPDSIDQVKTETTIVEGRIKHGYSFPKVFHVSPFMEMEYWYDWSFIGFPGNSSSLESKRPTSLTVVNTLRSRVTNDISFTAKLITEGQKITPFGVAWQIARFPAFCIIIQIWIHYQAAMLFLKGIVYVPHPQGTETTASKIIASIMTPFFAIRDNLNPKSKTA
jgi:DUF1365 family protein